MNPLEHGFSRGKESIGKEDKDQDQEVDLTRESIKGWEIKTGSGSGKSWGGQ